MEKRLQEILARKSEIRKALDAATHEELKAFSAEVDALEKEQKQIEERTAIAGKISSGAIIAETIPKIQTNKESELAYRMAFMEYVTRGKEISKELRANTLTTDAGAAIPSTVLDLVIEKLANAGMILPLVTKTSYLGGVTIPVAGLKPVATWVGEGATSTLQKKTTGGVTFTYNKLRCAVSCSLEIANMTLASFEANLTRGITEAMTAALEQAVISGTGTGQPKGVIKETPNAGQALAAQTPTFKALCDAEAALPQQAEAGAVWVMTKKTFMAFVAVTDTNGQPVARTNFGLASAPERFLLGRPVVLCDYLPTYATTLTLGDIWAMIFDFSDYVINTNYEIALKKYEDNVTDDVVTKAILLADGKVIDLTSLVVLKK